MHEQGAILRSRPPKEQSQNSGEIGMLRADGEKLV